MLKLLGLKLLQLLFCKSDKLALLLKVLLILLLLLWRQIYFASCRLECFIDWDLLMGAGWGIVVLLLLLLKSRVRAVL
jgi:hypothetical protein